jgi:hypothetical protein
VLRFSFLEVREQSRGVRTGLKALRMPLDPVGTPLAALELPNYAQILSAAIREGLRRKRLDDRKGVYPGMYLDATCACRGVTVSELRCERKSRWNITLSKERRSLR